MSSEVSSGTDGKSSKASKAHWPLIVGAVGVVYGDIGTSPLYTMKECLAHAPQGDATATALGCASLVFWALLFVVTFKYITFITRADNQGEGGIFALLALRPKPPEGVKTLSITVLVILAGAALLYGDGMITPAISVLSAAEGLKGVDPAFGPWVIPISVALLGALFWFQKRGTGRIGSFFGPIMLLWFAVIGLLGLWQIIHAPTVLLAALNPWYGLRLLVHPQTAAGLLGAVVLAITGAEALYADMGHFGRSAIVRGWNFIAFPGLALNYLGQAAWLLRNPGANDNPFFAMLPSAHAQLFLVGLSIAATFIASQALISGTFSLTRQAVHLGYFPRLGVIHTNAEQEGQIYIGFLNWSLGLGCIFIVINFGSSDALASAYGIAVTGTMVATTVAFYRVTRSRWGWGLPLSLGLCGLFIAVDGLFLVCNLPKFFAGGWLPILIGAFIFVIMITWKRGRTEIVTHMLKQSVDISLVVQDIEQSGVYRVPGAAVFMSALFTGTPIALLHHLKANRCLHKTVILLTLHTEGTPRITDGNPIQIEELGGGIWRVLARYGYMENPKAPGLMKTLIERGIPIIPASTTYYFNRETVLVGGRTKMWPWQKELYRILSQNARPARDYYGIPPNQIIEMGLPVQL